MVSLRRRPNDEPNPDEGSWTLEDTAGFDLLPGQPLPSWALPPAPEPEPEPEHVEHTDASVGVLLVPAGAPAEGFAGVRSEVTTAPPLTQPSAPLFLPPPPGPIASPPAPIMPTASTMPAYDQPPAPIMPTASTMPAYDQPPAPIMPTASIMPAYDQPTDAPPASPMSPSGHAVPEILPITGQPVVAPTWAFVESETYDEPVTHDEPETYDVSQAYEALKDFQVPEAPAIAETPEPAAIPEDLSTMPAVPTPPTTSAPTAFLAPTVEQYPVPSAIPGVTFQATPFAPAPPTPQPESQAPAASLTPEQFQSLLADTAVEAPPAEIPPTPFEPTPAASAAVLYDVVPDFEETEAPHRHGDDGAKEHRSISRKALLVIGIVIAALLAAAYVIPNYVLSSDESVELPVTSSPFETPESAAGLTRIDGADQTKWAEATRASQAARGVGNPFAATYGTRGLPKAQIWGGAPAATQPASELTKAFSAFERVTASKLTGIAAVKATNAPGVMRCGTGIVRAKPSTVCFWTDPGSFGGVLVIGNTPSQAATAVQLRAAVEGL